MKLPRLLTLQPNAQADHWRTYAVWLVILSFLLNGCADITPGQNAAIFGVGAAGARILVGALTHEDMRSVIPQALAIGAAVGYMTYVIAKHQATERQARIAAQRARIYQGRLVRNTTPAKRKPRSRYVAVDAPRDGNCKGEASVMIYDTETKTLVSNEVYDLKSRPQVGHVSKFEEYNAEYIATGSGQ